LEKRSEIKKEIKGEKMTENVEEIENAPEIGNLTKHCKGCPKLVVHGNPVDCPIYPNPTVSMRWVETPNLKVGCFFNKKNIRPEEKKKKQKTRVGQQKQKKK
jgi:hypothetical protein